MINVAAIRMQQFGVQFYQASLTAEDIDKLACGSKCSTTASPASLPFAVEAEGALEG